MEKIKVEKPKKLFFADEMRYGLMSNFRRSWSRIGKRTVIPSQMEFKNQYIFSAIDPYTGDSFHQNGFGSMNKENVLIFINELKKEYSEHHIVIVWDNASSHKSINLDDVTIINLPPYSPQLNPVERFFGELRKITANRIFKSINEQAELLDNTIAVWLKNKTNIQNLTLYPWIKNKY